MSNNEAPGRTQILAEFIVLTLALVATWYVFVHTIYPAFGITDDAPVPARSIAAVLLIWGFLKTSGGTWHDVGLFRPKYIWLAILLGLGIVVVKIAVLNPVFDTMTAQLDSEPFDYAIFQPMRENPLIFAGWLTIAWTTAAFGEEIFFRGYLINRLETFFGGGTLALWAAAVGQGVIFGIGHAYQGPGGMVDAGLTGISFGIFYILMRRNLWPLIIAHGVYDSLGITLIYLNGVPSTS